MLLAVLLVVENNSKRQLWTLVLSKINASTLYCGATGAGEGDAATSSGIGDLKPSAQDWEKRCRFYVNFDGKLTSTGRPAGVSDNLLL